MLMTNAEQQLCRILQDLPRDSDYRYTDDASWRLQEALFTSLCANHYDYLRVLFHGRVPNHPTRWSLREAQGMTEDMEYTEAARGKPCGHIFKAGDSTYRCKTCTNDETCALCTRCFEASDHTGHIVTQAISPGNSGCCDCGDDEAWQLPVKCAIHTADESNSSGKSKQPERLPDGLMESIRMTVGRTMDYLIDVLSCSPENLRFDKNEQSIKDDEAQSRLDSMWYRDLEVNKPEYALILWNDEKHTVPEVERQVARACKKALSYGEDKANEINDTGRSVIEYSTDINKLLKVAKIIEQIKLTVTIRSSRDAFREQMCGTMIEWLGDIAGCSVGEDHEILRQTICEEILKPWRMGSEASNQMIGKNGLDDHEIDEASCMTNLVSITLARAGRQNALTGRMRVTLGEINNLGDESDEDNDNDDEDNDEDGDSELGESTRSDPMDIELTGAAARDLEMRTPGDLEDETEVSEATYAGYPPPPPPPPAPNHVTSFQDNGQHSSVVANVESLQSSTRAEIPIPVTSWRPRKKGQAHPPSYWLDSPNKSNSREPIPLYEDLRQRIRLDWLLLYDLRLWKQVRINLRDLYISTVVSIARFKRVLGLRLAGLYGVLAQLYLVADREPDHSIVNLSLQTFTTPSITQEVVERGNFLTTLFSILYTFLTKRTVQHPWQVGIEDALNFEHGAVANRRMYHFFQDLKRIFSIPFVQSELRTQERYVLQFLDLVRLPQGICPNVRAVGEHVEYESDTWIAAQLLTKEINKICRQYADVFDWKNGGLDADLARTIRTVAKATVLNSLGAERMRFDQAEVKTETRFKTLEPFAFENTVDGPFIDHMVVDFVVEREPISFHHALHYTLSWLIDAGKSMPSDRLGSLLSFTIGDLTNPPVTKSPAILVLPPEDYLLATFDYPLRVCAWLAQMKAGMWVRNGISLRHQMTTYRGVSHRDLAHHRDIFLLQTALVVCQPNRVLASMIERFGMDQWMRGDYVLREGFELGPQLDVAEDLIHLLIVLLSDRTSLRPLDTPNDTQTQLAIRRDITHILCFKPLSFSELNNRFADKATDLEEFQDILEDMTTYRPPEGLADTGSFELKAENLADIDPYTAHYTKNQRDEAENAYRKWVAQKTGIPVLEVVYEPKLQPIESGVFQKLSSITKTTLFAQVIFYSMAAAFDPRLSQGLPLTRIESYLQVVLSLVLIAVLEDETCYTRDLEVAEQKPSFVDHALHKYSELGHTILDILIKVLENDDMKACHPKTRLILHRMSQKQLHSYDAALKQRYAHSKYAPKISMDSLGFETPRTPLDDDQEAKQRLARELKKKQALDRQARVMAQMQQQQQNFLNNQSIDEWNDEETEMESTSRILSEEHSKTWKYPAGNCILCQEEANESKIFGTFALMTNSTIFRKTNVNDPDFLGEVLSTPPNLDRSAEMIRPFGLARQNRREIIKRAADGHEFTAEHQGIGKGFPMTCSTRSPVSTGCGHIMHYSCFDAYNVATRRRQEHQIARNHPERVDLKEFVCPLCKALGNAFLPIIWKGKEEAYPGVLETEVSFDEWLSSGVGLSVSRFFKGQEGKTTDSRRQENFASYTSRMVMPSLANWISNSARAQAPLSSPTSPLFTGQSSLQGLPGVFPGDGHSSHQIASPVALSSELQPSHELSYIYNRLWETMRQNELPSRFSRSTPDAESFPEKKFRNTDTLAQTLGYSIVAAEIAQRGTEVEPGQTLINKVPSSLLTHLRIFSETVSSYIAIGGMHFKGNNVEAYEFKKITSEQIAQLFAGHDQVIGNTVEAIIRLSPALDQDPFIMLVECSVYLAPAVHFDIHHLLQLCYLLELVRVAFYLTSAPASLQRCLRTLDMGKGVGAGHAVPTEDLAALNGFVAHLAKMSDQRWPLLEDPKCPYADEARELYPLLHRAMSTYALSFLRKAAIFLNIKYGLDYPNTGFTDVGESELSRLSKILRIPTLRDIFSSLSGDSGNNSENRMLTSTVNGWIAHWLYSQNQEAQTQPSSENRELALKASVYDHFKPGHPVIFELIGLPKHFDTLTYEVTKRRCPTKGHKLEDPALCLFCGAIFCSQALCCSKDDKGGANQHMQM